MTNVHVVFLKLWTGGEKEKSLSRCAAWTWQTIACQGNGVKGGLFIPFLPGPIPMSTHGAGGALGYDEGALSSLRVLASGAGLLFPLFPAWPDPRPMDRWCCECGIFAEAGGSTRQGRVCDAAPPSLSLPLFKKVRTRLRARARQTQRYTRITVV